MRERERESFLERHCEYRRCALYALPRKILPIRHSSKVFLESPKNSVLSQHLRNAFGLFRLFFILFQRQRAKVHSCASLWLSSSGQRKSESKQKSILLRRVVFPPVDFPRTIGEFDLPRVRTQMTKIRRGIQQERDYWSKWRVYI